MDIEGTVTMADIGRLVVIFIFMWLSFRAGRVWEATSRDREEEW